MFRVLCHIGDTSEEVTWHDGRIEPDWIEELVQFQMDLYGSKSIMVNVQCVPLTLTNDLAVWRMLTEIFQRVELLEGHIESRIEDDLVS